MVVPNLQHQSQGTNYRSAQYLKRCCISRVNCNNKPIQSPPPLGTHVDLFGVVRPPRPLHGSVQIAAGLEESEGARHAGADGSVADDFVPLQGHLLLARLHLGRCKGEGKMGGLKTRDMQLGLVIRS